MMERRFFDFVLDHRRAVLGLVALITVVAALFATRVRFDSSIESWFLQDNQQRVTYERFLERFDADEITVVAVFADAPGQGDLFTPDHLARLWAMTAEAQKAPWTHRVRSLANVRLLVDRGGVLEVGPLREAPPTTMEDAAAFKAEVLANPLLVGNLVSAEGDGAALVVELDPAGNSFDAKMEHVRALREISDRLAGDMTVRLTGSPPIDEAFMVNSARDYALLGPVMVALVVLVLTALFRRLAVTAAGLSVVLLATLWTLGLMGVLGYALNVISAALVTLILASGVATVVHLLSSWTRRVGAGQSPRAAAAESAALLLLPVFFTTATNGAGFLSLNVSQLKPITEMGVLTTSGVVFSFLLSMTLLPILLAAIPAGPAAPVHTPGAPRGLQRVLRPFSRLSVKASRGVLLGALALSVASALSLGGMKVGANVTSYFLPTDPVRVHLEEVDRRMGGTANLEFLVSAPDGGLLEPEILARLDGLERWVEELPGVTTSLSVVDLFRGMAQVLSGGDPAAARLPDSREMAAQLGLLMEGDAEFSTLVQEEWSVGRISARAQISAAGELTQRIDDVEEKLAREFNDDHLRVEFTGFWKLMSDMENYLVRSQIESFLIAFGVISVMMFVLLGSIKLGLLAMVPNVLPILWGLGLMVALGINLDPGTAMIGCIAMGLVVDDTVHLLVHLRRHLRQGMDLEAALEATLDEVGVAVVMTSIVLALGFSVMALATFSPNRNFGVVATMVVLMAMVGELLVLPAVLKVLRPRVAGERLSLAEVAEHAGEAEEPPPAGPQRP